MNKLKILRPIVLIFIIFCISSCENNRKNEPVNLNKFRKIAWDSLSETTQKTVLNDWQQAEAKVRRNPDNNLRQVVIVTFHTPYDELTCPILVYVDVATEKVVYPKNIMLCN